MILPLPRGEGEALTHNSPPTVNPPPPPTSAELRMLLIDCLGLWGVEGRVSVSDDAIEIATPSATLRVQRAPRDMLPARWLLHRSATRPPRVAPSIVALLTALRNALGAEGGNRVRIGGSA
jgi:hypothetical protein